ncbi:MAG: ATP-binding protein [Eubacterium sp.]|nr:ATP-binding protein [Eubacterium sp.]
MVNIEKRLEQIKKLVDEGKYFSVNKARQYGKTTTLMALGKYLQKEYYVVSMDFQTFGNAEFQTENRFSLSFAGSFLRLFLKNRPAMSDTLQKAVDALARSVRQMPVYFALKMLFEQLSEICEASDKPLVLIIDEVDSAANNQVFVDFLAQLRAQYLNRFCQAAFWSVILAGVYDIRHLKQKLRQDEEHRMNSPWNIAAEFKVDFSFSKDEIAAMLREYGKEQPVQMDIGAMAGLLWDYTEGYPFLVSRLCQLLDEEVSAKTEYASKEAAWTKKGFHEAVRLILWDTNTLFASLTGKLHDYPKLGVMLRTLLFTGRTFSFRADGNIIDIASMFGFIKNQNGTVAIANRIFETYLYNYFLSEDEMRETELYKASLQDKSQFLTGGYLNMRRVLEKFVAHFHEIYGSRSRTFLEEEGRQYFLLYLKPIINGTGNYYIEARTRDLGRTDVVVDYRGEQHVIEMKLWHGEEYNRRGEQQLLGYLDSYRINQGYMLSFNFNKHKTVGVHEIRIGDKTIIEAVV